MAGTHGRSFDLVLWGATGYTGRLVAMALADTDDMRLRWALAGRDRGRLESLRTELGRDDLEVLTTDAHDEAGLDMLATTTRVIASTVGPYAAHGTSLVAACAANGTHYADIAGEVLWMRHTIDSFHSSAARSGARIVHACGFDSVPSDVGVWWLQRIAVERYGRPCASVLHGFGPMVGGFSGGTIASALALARALQADPAQRKALADPDLLAPGAPASVPAAGAAALRWAAELGAWTAPFFMAPVNEAIVRRTRALLGEPWGTDFAYRERWSARGWGEAVAVAAATSVVPAAAAVGPVRRWAERRLPRGGEGPSAAVRARGYFRTTLVGRVEGAEEPIVVRVACDQDPGYAATALMLREAALCLAHEEFGPLAGVLTPAVAFGGPLLHRLQRSGVRFELVGG